MILKLLLIKGIGNDHFLKSYIYDAIIQFSHAT